MSRRSAISLGASAPAQAGSAPTPILAREAPIPGEVAGPVVVTLDFARGARWADVPDSIRLRSALKLIGRDYGVRCVAIRRVEETS